MKNAVIIACAAVLVAGLLSVAEAAPDDSKAQLVRGAREIPNDLLSRANSGEAEAQYEIGNIYFDQGIPAWDAQKAAEWYRKAAEQGHLRAQWLLAVIYGTGLIGTDYATAYKWAREAAEQGLPDAEAEVGYDYAHGRGVQQDNVEAYFWYSLAATHSDVLNRATYITAVDALGALSKAPNEFQRDKIAERLQAWKPPVSQNAPPKQPMRCQAPYEWPFFAAALYEGGFVVPKDLSKAADLFRKAAEQGSKEARCKLADFYLQGTGVPQDFSEAYVWAAAAGSQCWDVFKDAKVALETLKFPDEEFAKLDQRVQPLVKPPASITMNCGTTTIDFYAEMKEIRPFAEQGDALSQARLADLYKMVYDASDAYFWAMLALQRNCDQQCTGFASHTLNQIGPELRAEQRSALEARVKEWKPQHLAVARAMMWELNNPLYQGAQAGVVSSQYALANIYADAQGTHKNFQEAYFWYCLAAKAEPGNKIYSSHRAAIKGNLTPREIEIIDGRVRTWKAMPSQSVYLQPAPAQ